MIYWFTGQPGSGKTVLANLLKERFLPHAFRIDGDEMRDLFSNKDYSIKGRITNIDTAQKISHYLHNQGKDVIVSLVSPYLDQREEFKTLLDWQIREIYVHYNTLDIKRGKEKYHVDNFGVPKKDFIDADTTKIVEIESIINIASKLNL
tara:strand:+ start:5787 stop:6233 length:447 start_codon:yes stop_codon:yes gene_type:complete